MSPRQRPETRETILSTELLESLDPWQDKRRRRMEFIRKLLISQEGVDESRFLGEICSQFGIRRSTLKEYLKELQDGGVIEIRNGRINPVGRQSNGRDPL